MRRPLKHAPEMTTCEVCGGRVKVPPGVYYRGKPMHKQEADRQRQIDLTNEVKSPYLASVEQEVSAILDVSPDIAP